MRLFLFLCQSCLQIAPSPLTASGWSFASPVGAIAPSHLYMVRRCWAGMLYTQSRGLVTPTDWYRLTSDVLICPLLCRCPPWSQGHCGDQPHLLSLLTLLLDTTPCNPVHLETYHISTLEHPQPPSPSTLMKQALLSLF